MQQRSSRQCCAMNTESHNAVTCVLRTHTAAIGKNRYEITAPKWSIDDGKRAMQSTTPWKWSRGKTETEAIRTVDAENFWAEKMQFFLSCMRTNDHRSTYMNDRVKNAHWMNRTAPQTHSHGYLFMLTRCTNDTYFSLMNWNETKRNALHAPHIICNYLPLIRSLNVMACNDIRNSVCWNTQPHDYYESVRAWTPNIVERE